MKKILSVFIAIIFIGACSFTMPARLYTEDGKVFTVNFSYSGAGYGGVFGVFPDGEEFKGEYFTIANTASSASAFSTPWGPYSSLTVSEIGPQVSHVTAVGAKGTQIQCVSFPRGAHGFGTCKDSKGRDYRLHY